VPIAQVARALHTVVERHPDLRVVFVTHPNPLARGPVDAVLRDDRRILVLDALPYAPFVALLRGSLLAVSDSGGVQEEGPTLGVPVLVTRSATERPEGLDAGAVEIVGTEIDRIVSAVERLVDDAGRRSAMSGAGRDVYGDGRAAERIARILTTEGAMPIRARASAVLPQAMARG
jgi:UDP-N-acetylglucosamine 2-epimerase (non-hydrolysing)